jgi:hypothetical protein
VRRRDLLKRAGLGSIAVAALPSLLTLAASTAFAKAGDTEQTDRPEDALSLEPGLTLKGHLEAGTGGHFAYYKFDYSGNDAAYTIDLQITPDRYDVLQHAGFHVYGPDATKVYATGGVQQGLTPNISGDLIDGDAAVFTVQVYNTQGLPPPTDMSEESGPD